MHAAFIKEDRLYGAACAYALCAGAASKKGNDAAALAKKCAAEAMTLLKQAVAKGFSSAGHAAHMKRDTDLDALRQREDFKQLVAGLEAGKKK